MENVILSEAQVENIMRDFLKKNGFIVKDRIKKQGVDIEAFKGEEKFYFEVEGSEKPGGRQLAASQFYTHFNRCIGQICKRLELSYNCFIVLPKHDTYLRYSKDIHKARFSLKVPFLFVEDFHKLYIMKPDSKELTRISKI